MAPTALSPDRAERLSDFIRSSDWASATSTPLAGDASRRRYMRLTKPDGSTAIVMDAPPEAGEDVRPFIKVAAYLRDLNLSAPEIYTADEARGFLILEDFGHDLYDVICDTAPAREPELYDAAVDVLIALTHSEPLHGAKDYVPNMTDLALSSFRWYAAPLMGRDMTEDAERARSEFTPLINSLGPARVTILRDYHAQNLLWLPDREARAKVGLLDFQDAMLGPPAYDLISLTTDARRDVSPEIATRCRTRFADALSLDPAHFAREAAICSVQRNLRILMVFARMSLHFGKPHYVDLIPRVWGHLQNDLTHPDLAPLAKTLCASLPEPTPETLKSLKDQCGTVPTLQ